MGLSCLQFAVKSLSYFPQNSVLTLTKSKRNLEQGPAKSARVNVKQSTSENKVNLRGEKQSTTKNKMYLKNTWE